ncbi:Crp/Fnr family transcriptional regulator [Cytobacillus gottheilii]|uniref:Crp/Fnr family transcriptional regulator n=1 Tax=Cytobacillus gottheilii TaxID=859144 RepID=UPI002495577E|nr:Crp/Fnr family transcriptional regulator [Cytobacillus gottheilii]
MSITHLSPILQKLTASASYKVKMNKGEYLFQDGETAKGLYLLLTGKVQITKIIPNGKELTLRMSGSGEIVGDMSIFCAQSQYTHSAKIIEDGEAAVIPKAELNELLKKDHQLTLELLEWISLQNQINQTKLRDLVLHGKKGALYSTLIRLSNSYGVASGKDIRLDSSLTNQDLANFCGTSREVINRMLSDLRKNKIISINKGYITIHNLSFLKDEIDCENCPISICSIE